MGQLSLDNVCKRFGAAEVIRGVSLDVVHGEFLVFVGPSGCGKSTLLRMIAGLEEISHGDVIIDGVRVNNLPPVERGIAMVFQSYALYPHMSVFENIAFPLRVARCPADELQAKVARAASILRLEERLHYRPGALSGGQRQRVAIGRAIVREPSVFLFDEPLSNLDASLRAKMRIELSRLHSDLDATMVYVTHDQVEAMTMADRIVVLDGGLISQVGTPLELYHNPANSFVAGFIGNPKMNFLPVICVGASEHGIRISLGGGDESLVPVRPRADMIGEKLVLGIRPEHTSTGHHPMTLALQVREVERLGMQTLVYCVRPGKPNTPSPTSADDLFCSVQPGAASIRIGEAITLRADPNDCHLFDSEGAAFERIPKII